MTTIPANEINGNPINGTSGDDTINESSHFSSMNADSRNNRITTGAGADKVYYNLLTDGYDQIDTTNGATVVTLNQQQMFTYSGSPITLNVSGLHAGSMLSQVTLLNANLPNLRDVNIELSSPSDQRQVLLNFHNTGFHFRGNYVVNNDGIDVNYPIYNDDDNYYMNEILSSDKPAKPFDRDNGNQVLLSDYTGDMNGDWKLHLVAQYYNDETISTEEGADTIDGYSLTFEGDSKVFDNIYLAKTWNSAPVYGLEKIRLTFDQTRVGNGKAHDSAIDGDGGLAVRIQSVNGFTGTDVVDEGFGRADDETIAYSTTDGSVIEIYDLITGLSHSELFNFVVMGHQSDDFNYLFNGINYSGNMYIHGGAGSDAISGDLGNDVIVGGTGADNLFASVGKDTFVYTSIKDSLRNASDYLFYFDVNEDVIDLRALGVLEFSSQGAAQRSVWIAPNDSEGYTGPAVFFDTTGDGQADGKISLQTDTPTLTASNFVLTPEPNVAIGEISLYGLQGINEDRANQTQSQLYLKVTAVDANKKDQVSYQLESTHDGLFEIDTNTGEIRATRLLDIETMPSSYTLTAIATSTDGSSSRKTFDFSIYDVDEFPSSELTDRNALANAVHHLTPVGTEVGITAQMTDADRTTISYSMENSAGGYFKIDRLTGVVTTAQPVEYLIQQTQQIVVAGHTTSGATQYQTYTIQLFDLVETNTRSGAVDNSARNELIRVNRVADSIDYDLSNDGVDHIHTIEQPSQSFTPSTINLSATDAPQIRLTLNLADIGNGSAFDAASAPNQELFGLAVRLQAEDATGNLVGVEGRADDEAVQYVAATGTTFDIRDQAGVSVGDQFARAVMGSSASESLNGSAQADYLHGGLGDDILLGGSKNDVLMGGDGHDRLKGEAGADLMIGGKGNDHYYVSTRGDGTIEQADEGRDSVFSTISWDLAAHIEVLKLLGQADIYAKGNAQNNTMVGNSGANVMDGELGQNRLTGGEGNDTYILRRDYSLNVIEESTAMSGGIDQVQFGVGVNSSQVWFSQVNNDLQASIIGTDAKVLIKDWYSSGMSVESFKLSNGQQLAAADVQNLVNAMASLTPPAMGQTTLSTQQKSALNGVIGSNWMTMSAT